jgi:hypothetical protein
MSAKKITSIMLLIPATILLLACFGTLPASGGTNPAIILDTDFSPDADDVGAVALMHRLANDGKIDIPAMMISSGDPWSARALAFTNSYYGRANIPIGMADGLTTEEPSAYAETLARQDPRLDFDQYSAVDLYRRVLAAQPERSVTVIAIGSLTNLARLLDSGPDRHSPLDGVALVERSVSSLVCMGGEYPSGREWNFYQDPGASRRVAEGWPTPITFVGFELGEKIITGKTLDTLPLASPLYLSYLLHNDFLGRPSWDQLAVLYGAADQHIREKLFSQSPQGLNVVNSDGSNHWLPVQNGPHAYLKLGVSGDEAAALIDQLMLESESAVTTAASGSKP